MRPTTLRLTATFLTCGMALLLTSCKSNNTDKIVGKWKIVSTSRPDPEMAKLKAMDLAMAWEFKADGTFALTVVPERNTPEVVQLAKATNDGLKQKDLTGRYTLGFGNRVNISGSKQLFDGKSEHTDVIIDGDSMKWRDSDGYTVQFVRVK